MRERLAEFENFEPFSVYRCIDVHKIGYVVPKMLQKYLLRNVSVKECQEIIESIAKPREPSVSIDSFKPPFTVVINSSRNRA
jgi:hypothetical protein